MDHSLTRCALKRNTPQTERQQTRRRAIEILLVGVSIGLTVVLIRAFTPAGSQLQWVLLILAAAVLTVVHLAVRRSVRRMLPPRPVRLLARQPRPDPSELFANELDRSWTGLAEPVAPSEQRGRLGE